jgi:hypothetical protein
LPQDHSRYGAWEKLQRGAHQSTIQLEAEIHSFIERYSDNPKPFRWTKSADQILASVKRFCQKTDQTSSLDFKLT